MVRPTIQLPQKHTLGARGIRCTGSIHAPYGALGSLVEGGLRSWIFVTAAEAQQQMKLTTITSFRLPQRTKHSMVKKPTDVAGSSISSRSLRCHRIRKATAWKLPWTDRRSSKKVVSNSGTCAHNSAWAAMAAGTKRTAMSLERWLVGRLSA